MPFGIHTSEKYFGYQPSTTELALKVCKDDAEVDQLNAQIFRETVSYMIENPQTISRATKISSISKYLGRIADHAGIDDVRPAEPGDQVRGVPGAMQAFAREHADHNRRPGDRCRTRRSLVAERPLHKAGSG